MDLENFVKRLDPILFRALIDACLDRVQSEACKVKKLTYAERELAKAGKRIMAIRSVRNRLSIGLKEAKDLVDLEVPRPIDGSSTPAQWSSPVLSPGASRR